MGAGPITLSVVSHRQNRLVNTLLLDLAACCAGGLHVVVTENIPDREPLAIKELPYSVELVANPNAKGFGANHNAAFERCATPLFCVCNPDIRLAVDPFPRLAEALRGADAAAAGPLVVNPAGGIEDSARRFPTPLSLLRRGFRTTGPDYPVDAGTVDVDWVAGMFMLFDAEAFRLVRGFDERYFLYYEDIDICRRLRHTGRRISYVPGARVVHDARRGSRRNPALARHHIASMLRFFAER